MGSVNINLGARMDELTVQATTFAGSVTFDGGSSNDPFVYSHIRPAHYWRTLTLLNLKTTKYVQ